MWYQRKIIPVEKGIIYPRKYFVGNFKVAEWLSTDKKQVRQFVILNKFLSVKEQAQNNRSKELKDLNDLARAERLIKKREQLIQKNIATTQSIKEVIEIRDLIKRRLEKYPCLTASNYSGIKFLSFFSTLLLLNNSYSALVATPITPEKISK